MGPGLPLVLACLLAGDALAQLPPQRLADMHHTAWTAKDGLRGFVEGVVQTPNGFLWVGTSEGVYRFDGVRFELYQPKRGAMAAVAVSTMAATPEGGLWIGHSRGGVSYLAPDGTATGYSVADSIPLGSVRDLAVDRDGAVWLAATGGLARFTAGRWERIRKNWNYPCSSAWDVFVDARGTVWVGGATPNRIVYLRRGETQFVDVGLDESADGFVNVNDSTLVFGNSAFDLGTLSLLVTHADRVTTRVIGAGHGSNGMVIDRNGFVWVAGRGITRFHPTASPDSATQFEQFTRDEGLSGSSGRSVMIDLEGSVWVATDGGLDRFRHRNLTWKTDSLSPLGASLFRDASGEAWVMTFRPTSLRRARDFAPVAHFPDLLDNGYLDPRGMLWILTREGLYRWANGRFDAVAPPAGVPLRFNAAAAARQRSGRLWVSIAGFGVFTLDDSVWTHRTILPGRADWTAVTAHVDAEDRIWLAYRDEIAMIRGDEIRIFDQDDGLVGPITTIRGINGLVLAGGEPGLQMFRDNRFHPVQFVGGAIGGVSTIVPTDSGIWLAGSAGVLRIPRREADSLAANPAYRVTVEIFDMESDLPDAPKLYTRGYTIGTEDGNGILWFATNRGLARIDPRTIVRNQTPPPVAFRAVFADDQRFWPQGPITIPALTRSLRIEFTALSLVNPARVRFRHRLEGWETEWHEPHDRREVTYTDLRPGAYVLRVMASNNDGVWNEAGAALPFTVAPAWFQSPWFRMLVVITLVAGAVAAYRFRVRQLAAALSARFNERLAERTRIARELHDTLMQTVQASRMVAEAALTKDEPTGLRDTMQRLSTWLGQAVDEGRGALKALRAATGSATDLANSLRHAAANAATDAGLPLAVSVTGAPPGELHSLVCDEIYHIGSEAIHNACAHSHGTQLEIALEYGRDLLLRVRDNGVGITPAIAAGGKEGHFGLKGMRERAAAIGASLSIDSSAAGTSITLIVPGRRVYRADPLPRTTPPLRL